MLRLGRWSKSRKSLSTSGLTTLASSRLPRVARSVTGSERSCVKRLSAGMRAVHRRSGCRECQDNGYDHPRKEHRVPFDSKEKRRAWSRKWKEANKGNGYNDWLYGRRKLRFDDAKSFREALERIAGGEYHASSIAKTYLKESDRRRDALGPSPRANGIPVPKEAKRTGDTLAEALAKLGLK